MPAQFPNAIDAGTYRQIQIWYYPEFGQYEFTYLGDVYTLGTLEQTTAMIDNKVSPPPPPVEDTTLIETYRGIEIYENAFGLYQFQYEDEWNQYYTLDLTRGFIDRLLEVPDDEPPDDGEPPPPPEEIIPTTVGAPKLPWYAAWLKPITEYIGSLTESVVNFFAPIFSGIKEIPANLMNLPKHIMTSLIDYMLDITLKASQSSITSTLQVAKDITSQTPKWKKDLDETLEPFAVDNVLGIVKSLSPETIGKSPLNWEEASIAASGIITTVTGVGIGLWLAHGAAEAASLGQYEAIRDLEHMVIARLGLSALGAKALSIPLNELIFKRTQQFYAAQFTPEIPNVSDLVEMVVKEKMELDEFKGWMKYKGLDNSWSQLIWDSHFIHPSYDEIRKAFYRSEWDEETLEAYLKRVDLDPEFNKEIWLKNLGEIPPYSELTNLRVKEVIGENEYAKGLKFHGIEEVWAKRIWDGHFQPPGLSDILTAYRRKIPVSIPVYDETTGMVSVKHVEQLSLDDVRGLMVLVDLDPRYMSIFETRFNVDPSLTMTRFMFETGAIDDEKVTELVEREGYYPEYVEPISQFITRFQERRWRTRYLVQLQRGYAYGVYTDETLKAEVVAAGYTPAVADWMIKTAEVQRSIRVASVRGGRPRILALGDLKKAFTRDRINSDELRTELLTRGYEIREVDILIELLESDKVFEAAGAKKKALTQAELMNAWKYQQITEDMLRTELQLRGLEQGEVEILINTKKLQWGIEIE